MIAVVAGSSQKSPRSDEVLAPSRATGGVGNLRVDRRNGFTDSLTFEFTGLARFLAQGPVE